MVRPCETLNDDSRTGTVRRTPPPAWAPPRRRRREAVSGIGQSREMFDEMHGVQSQELVVSTAPAVSRVEGVSARVAGERGHRAHEAGHSLGHRQVRVPAAVRRSPHRASVSSLRGAGRPVSPERLPSQRLGQVSGASRRPRDTLGATEVPSSTRGPRPGTMGEVKGVVGRLRAPATKRTEFRRMNAPASDRHPSHGDGVLEAELAPPCRLLRCR